MEVHRTDLRERNELYRKTVDSSDAILHTLNARDPIGTTRGSFLVTNESVEKRVVPVIQDERDRVRNWVSIHASISHHGSLCPAKPPFLPTALESPPHPHETSRTATALGLLDRGTHPGHLSITQRCGPQRGPVNFRDDDSSTTLGGGSQQHACCANIDANVIELAGGSDPWLHKFVVLVLVTNKYWVVPVWKSR